MIDTKTFIYIEKQEQKGSNNDGSVMGRKIYKGNR